jgi:outer membrane lipoprotein-sorting protein
MRKVALLSLSLFAMAAAVSPQSQTSTANQIIENSQQAFYYAGTDMKAKVVMDLITDSGNRRTRVLTMLRKNDARSKNQKYFMYFHEPGDVRGTAFLVWKYPDKDADRWIFIPAVNMIRRVAAKDSRSSFVGSDFSYEDVSGRNLADDNHTLLREEKFGESECYVIESVPKAPMDYIRKLNWIDKKTFLPLKEEYYDAQNELARVFTADKVEVVGADGGKKGYPTVVKRTMKNVKSGHRTEVTYLDATYDVGINESVFVQQSLESPPGKWIR